MRRVTAAVLVELVLAGSLVVVVVIVVVVVPGVLLTIFSANSSGWEVVVGSVDFGLFKSAS